MTRDEILKMEADRELDALVAQKVFGLVPIPITENGYIWDDEEEGCFLDITDAYYIAGTYYNHYLPDYSTDIAAAWKVVEKMRAQEMDFKILSHSWAAMVRLSGGNWHVEFDSYQATADTAPLAICRAALLAMEEG